MTGMERTSSQSGSVRQVVLTALLALGCVLVGAAPASAVELAQRDGRGDFWHDVRPEGDPVQVEPLFGNPDLWRVVYRHTDNAVKVRMAMADVTRFGYWQFDVHFKTDDGLNRRIKLFRADGTPERLAFVKWSGDDQCDISWDVDLSDDVVTVSVPRRCLEGPDTVAFRSATNFWPTSDEEFPFRDIAGTDGFDFTGWSTPLARD